MHEIVQAIWNEKRCISIKLFLRDLTYSANRHLLKSFSSLLKVLNSNHCMVTYIKKWLLQTEPKNYANKQSENNPANDSSNDAFDDDISESLWLPVLLEFLPRCELLVDLHFIFCCITLNDLLIVWVIKKYQRLFYFLYACYWF